MPLVRGLILVAALLSVAMSQLPTPDTGECSLHHLTRCSSRVVNLMQQVVNGIVPTIDPEYLDTHCEELLELMSCFDDQTRHCHQHFKNELEGFVLAYEWICEDGQEGYHEYASCLHSQSLITEVRVCNDTWTTHQARLPGLDDIIRSKRQCQYANDLLDCVENAATADCDKHAGAWLRHFDSRLYQPQYEARGCVFHGNEVDKLHSETDTGETHYHYDRNAYGIVAFLVIVIIILMAGLVFAIVMYAFAQRRYRLQLSAPSMQYSNGRAANTQPSFNNPIASSNTSASYETSRNQPHGGYDQPVNVAHLPESNHYARFENEAENGADQSAATGPEDVDITSGVGHHGLSPSHGYSQAYDA